MTTTYMSFLSRTLLLFIIWWVLTEGVVTSLAIGLPAIILAAIISIRLLPATHFSWFQFILFMPFFIRYSLQGGIDVAWRAFHPDMPIAPATVSYKMQLPEGLAQVFMALTVNLLPGTLSTEINNNTMIVHVLDSQSDYQSELAAVEQKMARIFSLPLKYNERS